MEQDTIFTIKTCFFQAMKCLIYYYHSMNWSLYSSCICVVPLSCSMFLYCVHVIFVILRLIKKLGHLKGRSPKWEGLGAHQWCWCLSHPDVGCPGVPAAPPVLSVFARCAPAPAPAHHQQRFSEGGGESGCLGDPLSSCQLSVLPGAKCRGLVCAHSEPTINWHRELHGSLLLLL